MWNSNPPLLNPLPEKNVHTALEFLSKEAKELYIDDCIDVIEASEITSLSFYRTWVAGNKPVLIKNAVKHWKAYKAWTNEYLREKIGNEAVTVAVTPNGYADAPVNSYFVLPEERNIKFNHFLNILEKKVETPGIFYIQKQNSNLTSEFSEIMNDVPNEVPWFSEALGKSPDAVNFWMGDERAVTSMHKDNYENIYCVIKGHKDFILHPPTDLPWIPYKLYPSAVYKMDLKGCYEIISETESLKVPWICIDPLDPDYSAFPQYKNATTVRCRVKEGDALFLPSLWFHHVQQSHGCIAVNYWYDMEYDLKYNYYKLLQNLTWCKISNN